MHNYKTLSGWFYDEARQEQDEEEVAELLRQEGIEGVVLSVIEPASERITEYIESGMMPQRAINKASEHWGPYQTKKFLAAYELEEQERADESYISDIEEFIPGTLEEQMNDLQTTLGSYYSDNPFHDDDVPAPIASAIMAARVHHETDMTEEQVGNITDVDNFKRALMESESVDEALRAHLFDTALPTDLRSVLAHPDEWDDDLDAANIPTRNCDRCSDRFYEVHHHEEGRCRINQYGEVHEVRHLGDPEDGDAFYRTDTVFNDYHSDGGFLCEECVHNWERNAVLIHVANGDGSYASVEYEGAFVLDRAQNGDEENATPVIDAPEDSFMWNQVRDYVSRSSGSGLISFSPDEGPGNFDNVREAMEYTIETFGENVPECRVIIIKRRNFDGRMVHRVLVPRDSPSGARWAKELLETEEMVSA